MSSSGPPATLESLNSLMIPFHLLKYRLLPILWLMAFHITLNAQTGSPVENSDTDSVQAFSGNGKFYLIFPLVHAKVVYADSVMVSTKRSRDSFLYKAKLFFSNHEDAKYDFQSGDQSNGVVTYEGKLKKGYYSNKSDVYFSIDLDCLISTKLFLLLQSRFTMGVGVPAWTVSLLFKIPAQTLTKRCIWKTFLLIRENFPGNIVRSWMPDSRKLCNT